MITTVPLAAPILSSEVRFFRELDGILSVLWNAFSSWYLPVGVHPLS